LDRLQLTPIKSNFSSPVLSARDGPFETEPEAETLYRVTSTSPRIEQLLALIKALSTTSSSKALLSPWRISTLLDQAELDEEAHRAEYGARGSYEEELEWLLISKATVQTYGLILSTLLEQTIPLSNDIWYWDEVLGSYTYTGIYTVQTSPLRLWDWTKDIYRDSRERWRRVKEHPEDAIDARRIGNSLTEPWQQFYGLVRESIRDRSVADIQRRVLSPLALGRSEIRRKQAGLKRLREMSASGLGVLMDEGLSFDLDEGYIGKNQDSHEWKGVVERSVALMNTVLRNVTALETGVPEFEDMVFTSVQEDEELSTRDTAGSYISRPARLSRRLQHILHTEIPSHILKSQALRSTYGRPSILVRYWFPAAALLLSSGTILKILTNRKAEILQWIRDLGKTVQDFWLNWVIEPTLKILKTIRHDQDSVVAIMSRESLKGDRDSLERMVVDFALDNPAFADSSSPLNETQIAEIRAKVKEGDLTPVLRAYEKDLRKPFIGTIRGDLVRTLLIQVQKTKVDVEVALSGIDALLKSQELVFGFVGLTPGILVCAAAFQYLHTLFGHRGQLKQGRKAGQSLRVLRNIDRILGNAVQTPNGMLSYKDHGLLLCEVHVLRERAKRLFPGEVEREFLEDVGELADISIGVERQRRVVERIRWAYGKWLRN
jgi:nuclear-control-of-ATPase protein 2